MVKTQSVAQATTYKSIKKCEDQVIKAGCSLGVGDGRILRQLKQNSPAKLRPPGAL